MKELKQKLSKAFGKKNVTEAYDELTLLLIVTTLLRYVISLKMNLNLKF